MILNDLDLGSSSNAWPKPSAGQNVGYQPVEGGMPGVWARGGTPFKLPFTFLAKAWQGLGGNAAMSLGSARILAKQLEELGRNKDLQPCFIQPWMTADPAATYAGMFLGSSYHDGWYICDNISADYGTGMIVTGLVRVTMNITWVAPGPPYPHGMRYDGGALPSTYLGAAVPLLAYPLGSINQPPTAIARVGAEGSTPLSLSPSSAAANGSLPFGPGNLTQLFQGCCRVFDTMSLAGNPVPTTGAFVHASWVEVKGVDHVFVGDCIITNGLHLYRIQGGSVALPMCYIWSTGQATPGWFNFANPSSLDSGMANYTIRSYALLRVGWEEVRLLAKCTTGGGNWIDLQIRLQRGMYFGRVDITPRTQANASVYFYNIIAASTLKIAYNEAGATDWVVGQASLPATANYGYAAAFLNSAGQPFLVGLLYQNPSAFQPRGDAGTNDLLTGDNTGPALNQTRSYGVFAAPYGVNASYSPANLQAEAESGALGTGWTSQAGAGGNSNALEAKCASGTLTGNADLWGTSFIPPPGVYDLWVRMKVTSIASAVAQMQIGLWDTTGSAFVASTTYAPSQLAVGYAWYRVAASVTPTAAHNMQIRAVTTGTLATDFFIDESALVPLTIAGTNTGPQEIWQQFMHDRNVAMVRG